MYTKYTWCIKYNKKKQKKYSTDADSPCLGYTNCLRQNILRVLYARLKLY